MVPMPDWTLDDADSYRKNLGLFVGCQVPSRVFISGQCNFEEDMEMGAQWALRPEKKKQRQGAPSRKVGFYSPS
jgi:hypothetical protein